jgi:TAP-like protein
VVSNTGDPATPYQMGVDVAHTLTKGVLLTWQGHGHTSYGRSNACVTDNVDSYLITGTPPAAGTVC